MSIETVALKLPTFWTTCPSAWFALTEAQFTLCGISADETKYYHVVAALDAATASRSLAVISSPPPTCKYNTIKSFLTDAYGLSKAEKAAMLLDIKQLGDRKPSEVMDEMLALLGDHRTCFLFPHIFLRLLPEAIRAPLADNLYNSLTLIGTVCTTVQQPMKSLADLSEIDSICWFHRKFGSNARRCNNPCKYFQTFKRKVNQGNGRADQH
ncbi:retrovirus-related Pol polyprotein [Elysia marginata]|uniref:Retrovirus-related Pol polyprotein n=1 Tax=Elysia marginata TaxID=1093978 RepID=A0AAV4IEB9_9GAST|nr:retrovirus-related Pol polyprotein [Elysia marginata]